MEMYGQWCVSLVLAGQFHEQRQRDRDKLEEAQQHDLTIRDKSAVKQGQKSCTADRRQDNASHHPKNKLQIGDPLP